MNRLTNSWELIKASAAVLRSDKELIIFPIISGVLTLLVTLTFAVPTLFAGILDQVSTRGNVPVVGYVVAFLFYLVQYFVIIFCNTALVGAALKRLDGGNPSVSDGFSIAFAHLGSIFGFALISATVGLVLRTISRRGDILGQIVSSLFGLAWHLATYLVIPVLVVENAGPIEAIKRSAGYLRRTWGEQVVGNFGVGLIFGLLFILVIAVAVGLIVLAAAVHLTVLIVGIIVLAVLSLLFLGLLSSALGGIYEAAVYRYAAQGKVDGYFPPQLVQNAFKTR